eukprot:jgi/Ulvmu1/9038/UM005_0130.1
MTLRRVLSVTETSDEGRPLLLPRDQLNDVICEGTTYDILPAAMMCLSPCLCFQRHWRITGRQIVLQVGCRGTTPETLSLHRVKDIELELTPSTRCKGKGIITIRTSHEAMEELQISAKSAHDVYSRLSEAWRQAKDEARQSAKEAKMYRARRRASGISSHQ